MRRADVGPSGKGPLFLRTKSGDIPVFGLDLECGPGPVEEGKDMGDVEGQVRMTVEMGGSVSQPDPVVNCNCQVAPLCIDKSVRCKKVKASNKPAGPIPGQKFSIVQHIINHKGGTKRKKKGVKKRRTMNSRQAFTDSDPIQSSRGGFEVEVVGIDSGRRSFADGEGLELEVVLPFEHPPAPEPVAEVGGAVTGGIGGSGVNQLMGTSSHIRFDSPVSVGGSADRILEQAHHIIDIQEDLGMNFHGVEGEDVNRLVEFERRDRAAKVRWEEEQVINDN
jgi:hypothetical protein